LQPGNCLRPPVTTLHHWSDADEEQGQVDASEAETTQLKPKHEHIMTSLSQQSNTHARARTHPFNGPFSGTTLVRRYQKGKTNLDSTEARDSEWQWHQLGHMQVCISLQTDNHASTPPLKFFTGRMPFLPPNKQSQSTEGTVSQQSKLKTILYPACTYVC